MDRGRISEQRKEQTVASGKSRNFLKAQARERQEQSTVPEKGQEKARFQPKLIDSRLSLLAMRAQERREDLAGKNTSQDRQLAAWRPRTDAASGRVGSQSQENLPWSSELHLARKGGGSYGTETTNQQSTEDQMRRKELMDRDLDHYTKTKKAYDSLSNKLGTMNLHGQITYSQMHTELEPYRRNTQVALDGWAYRKENYENQTGSTKW